MDKILKNIDAMDDRTYSLFLFLSQWLLIAIGVTIYFACQIPYKLEQRERAIAEWHATHDVQGIYDATHTIGNDSTYYPEWLNGDLRTR